MISTTTGNYTPFLSPLSNLMSYSYASSTYYPLSNPSHFLTSYSETDPIFESASTSLAYLKTETDPIFESASTSLSYASLKGVNTMQGTTTFNNVVMFGNTSGNKGALELYPANGAYNWITISNDDAGSNEGLHIKKGAYPAVSGDLFSIKSTGDVTTLGNITEASGTVSVQGINYVGYSPGGNSATIATNTSLYFGSQFNYYMTTSAGISEIYIQKAGIIKNVQVSFRTGTTVSVGSCSATLYVRKNNTTDYSINTYQMNTGNQITQARYTVSVPVAVNDYIEFKLTTPTCWTTLPTMPGVYASAYEE